MRTVVQRVSRAEVVVDQETVGAIKTGLFILVGFDANDTLEDVTWMTNKLVGLRIFNDNEGKMNLSVSDIDGEALVVSQFTLHASTKKGTRPSFIKAGKPDVAIPLYEAFVDQLKAKLKHVGTGIFGADMKCSLTNDGPVTITIDTKDKQ